MRFAIFIAVVFAAFHLGAQQNDGPAASAEDLTAPLDRHATERMMPSSECVQLASGVDHAEALESFCHWVLTFRERLPNILSDEKMRRHRLTEKGWELNNTLTMKAHYSGGKVEYSELGVNGRATSKSLFDMEGAWSTGELGTTLEGVVMDARVTRFKFAKESMLKGVAVLGFDFEVPRKDNRSWALETNGKRSYVPGYKGRIWLEKSTSRMVQFERTSTDMDPKFPIQMVSAIIRYKAIALGDRTDFVLPDYSESVSCMDKIEKERFGNCMKNELTFENWRKFGAEHRILPEGSTLPPN